MIDTVLDGSVSFAPPDPSDAPGPGDGAEWPLHRPGRRGPTRQHAGIAGRGIARRCERLPDPDRQGPAPAAPRGDSGAPPPARLARRQDPQPRRVRDRRRRLRQDDAPRRLLPPDPPPDALVPDGRGRPRTGSRSSRIWSQPAASTIPSSRRERTRCSRTPAPAGRRATRPWRCSFGSSRTSPPTPTVLILDDFHVADGSGDVAYVAKSLITRAPERLTIVISSRRTPEVAVGRLRAQGELAELRTRDLQFSEREIADLFESKDGRHLDPESLDLLNRRSEGWAASLQLVHAAVRDRTSAEARDFIRGLSGGQDELYDYLAEEVVGDLSHGHQEFLMRTSILQVVTAQGAAVLADLTPPN